MGLFVKSGIIDKRIACDFWSFVVLRNWEALLPVTTYVRWKIGQPGLWENFEYMAALSNAYQLAHPTSYPKDMGRMPEDTTLIDAMKGTQDAR
jgi:hypothetical protein